MSDIVPFTLATEVLRVNMPANVRWAVSATKQVEDKTKPCNVTLTLYKGETVVGQYIGSSGQVYNDQAGDIRATIALEEGVTVCDGRLEVG